MDPDWIRFGVLGRAHGVRGEVRLSPDDPDVEFPEVTDVRLVRRGVARSAKVTSLRAAGDVYLATFEGVSDRDVVRDQLTGAEVLVPRRALAAADGREAYVFELVGAQVVDETGAQLGVVGAVLAGAAQDLLRIDSPQGERLLPMIADTMRGFDRARRVLTVAPIPGLWE